MTKSEKAHLNSLAGFGCVACFLNGTPGTPPEIHHIRAGVGMGQRSSHYRAIPLCHAHHRGTMHPEVPSIHRDKVEFERAFGTEEQLLEFVNSRLHWINK